MATRAAPSPSALFQSFPSKNRRLLILPRFLAEQADKQKHFDAGPAYQAAHHLLIKWADLESNGSLAKKETSLDANFLNDIFGKALGYTPIESATDGHHTLERQLLVPNVGPVDGALGTFPANPNDPAPVAVIELKGPATDLDTHRSNGRTAVNQLFDYLNALPNTKWGILSNISTIRLYHKASGSQAYEEFSLQLLRHADHFAAFWTLLEKSGLFPSTTSPVPRADALLAHTGARQKEVGDELYAHYSTYRSALIATLRDDLRKPLDEAIRIAQKIFDRIVFVAFAQSRGLITQNSIKIAVDRKRPFSRIKNPIWQNLVDLFHGVDKGHPDLGIEHGYNGGLFSEDPAIDDLQLPDEPWTTAFARFGLYDYNYEVNVDVLGHIFERSITELEKLRTAGLFSKDLPADAPKAKMQKSAERKRFGIYYTPPEFTRFIVKETVEIPLRQRFKNLEQAHNVTPEQLAESNIEKSPQLRAYYTQALQTLRRFKIVDPACGSGAFLIAAYECLDEFYDDITRHLLAQDAPNAAAAREQYPDFILTDNLHGVDLSEEAVEITRLALWIRSARPGKTLANLTHNIYCGNSLVDDPAVYPRAMNWHATFPQIFNTQPSAPEGAPGGSPVLVPTAKVAPTNPIPRTEPGFDAVVGNPPWERLKLQEREFFAFAAPDVASAVSAATRRRLIEQLETQNPELFARYQQAQQSAEKTSAHARSSGHYPLTAKGDINTYMLFAELARSLVAPSGRAGLLVPSGIATDNTTKDFFADLINSQSLIKLYDFENKSGFFEDVHRAFKFCTLILGGSAVKTPAADFVFFAHSMDDVAPENKQRHIPLSKKDIALLNPNTKTCPIFRTRKDAEITKAVYKKIPILLDENRKAGGNPWEVRFVRMFDQTNDADKFIEPQTALSSGYKFHETHWEKGKSVLLPLYEAKMAQAYDHRAASVLVEAGNWMRQGQTEETSPVRHQNPEFVAVPRFWIDQTTVEATLPRQDLLLGFKDITSPTNQRTMIASAIPYCGVTNHFVLVQSTLPPLLQLCLLANLNAFVYDYVTRQKIGGITLNFFIVEQLPTLPPDTYADQCPWNKKRGGPTLKQWISERVLKLSCTANDMIPLAKACSFNSTGDKAAGGIPFVWKWKDPERKDLRAQLDAAYFHLYGLSRDDTAYILSTFPSTGSPEDPHSITSLILSYYDQYTVTPSSPTKH